MGSSVEDYAKSLEFCVRVFPRRLSSGWGGGGDFNNRLCSRTVTIGFPVVF